MEPAQTSSPQNTSEPGRFVIGVRLIGSNETQSFDPGTLSLRVGTEVMVETQDSETLGYVASNKILNFRKNASEPVPRVLRIATPSDIEARDKISQLEQTAREFCLEQIARLELKMNLSRVVHLPDIRKTVFYFTAENRVDFRELVRTLAHRLRTKIEMRQVGVRDEAKAITGVGMCGQSLCCSTFLPEFTPVTVRMAKDQGLALNPSKISGVCGRLMCCLQYEHQNYRSLIKNLPKLNSRVETPDGLGKTLKNDILQQKVTVLLDDESIFTYHLNELKSLSDQKSTSK